MDKIKIALGCDDVGFEMKEALKRYLIEEKGADVVLDPITTQEAGAGSQAGTTIDICEGIQRDEFRLAVFICGTGIGFCHMANRFWGVRAATVSDEYSAERARKSADAQVLCLGSRAVTLEVAKRLIDAWYDEPFDWNRTSSVLNKKTFEAIEERQLVKPDHVAWSMGYSPN
jgi:ribose 5-phosphate isomerase B